jgi:uncharacterized flavoprotein (TIGR03862 family)
MTGVHADVVVIGGGPAGLMAAETLALGGCQVVVFDAKPSIGRKFLMAGKSGLNLTKSGDKDFGAAYAEAAPRLAQMISAFGPEEVMSWAEDLGQPLFVGTTGRVFPVTMKASPLLRAWMARLYGLGVRILTRHVWRGWDGGKLVFDAPDGLLTMSPRATVLAMGGASWSRLGSDGAWTAYLADRGVEIAPFSPANAALRVTWSHHMQPLFGAPLKSVQFSAGPYTSRGEAIISSDGLEGSGIYSVSRGVREGHQLAIDLLPDLSIDKIANKLESVKGKPSLTVRLRKALGFSPVKTALVNECLRPAPGDFGALARAFKTLRPIVDGLSDIETAISVAGGVKWDQLDDALMITSVPGVYCAGEMIDWEAPTGGYLLTACFATGRWAAQSALARLNA